MLDIKKNACLEHGFLRIRWGHRNCRNVTGSEERQLLTDDLISVNLILNN